MAKITMQPNKNTPADRHDVGTGVDANVSHAAGDKKPCQRLGHDIDRAELIENNDEDIEQHGQLELVAKVVVDLLHILRPRIGMERPAFEVDQTLF